MNASERTREDEKEEEKEKEKQLSREREKSEIDERVQLMPDRAGSSDRR